MDPIEKAIRTALEKGDADDADFRARVYRSVEAALDRVLQGNPQLTVEKAITRRRQLQQRIAEIESEFTPALAEDASDADDDLDAALLDILEHSPGETRAEARHPLPQSPMPDFSPVVASPSPAVSPALSGAGGRREPQFAAPEVFSGSSTSDRVEHPDIGEGRFSDAGRHPVEPSVDFGVIPQVPDRQEPDLDFPAVMPPPFDDPDMSAPVPPAPPEVMAVDRVARSRERRRPFAAIFSGIVLLSLAGVGLMFAFQTGLLQSRDQRDTSVHNPPADLGSEDFEPATGGPPALSDQPASQQKWIAVFSPSDPATATAPGDTRAESMQDDSGAFLRIRSGASGASVSFDVGQGVLDQLAGKKAVFNIAARGEEGQQTEMSIECNFGDLGDCGRKRYEVGYEKGEFLFEITFPDKRPGSSGTIAINSDFSGQGRSIDIYQIRVAAQ